MTNSPASAESAIEPVQPAAQPVPPGFWQREISHFPQPLTPMGAEINIGLNNKALRHAFDELSLLVETVEFREVGGWTYQRVVPLGGKDRKPLPPLLLKLLVRTVPQLRSRVRACDEAIRTDKFGKIAAQWTDEWRADLARRIAELQAVNLAGLDDAALLAQIVAALHLCDDGWDRHFLLHVSSALILAAFAFACGDLLGWDDRRAFELLNGLSTASTEPARHLAELVALAASRPAVKELLRRVDDSTPSRLREADPAFAAVLDAYLQRFGGRALRYELADPTLAELPGLTLALIRDQLTRGYDAEADAQALATRRAETLSAARRLLEGRPDAEREGFEQALARAERQYPIREENEFYTITGPLACLRYAMLEAGRRLVARGQLDRRDDVFFLTTAEVQDAVGDDVDRRPLVRRRLGEWLWAEQHPGPASYGVDPGPPPPTSVLPPRPRYATEAFLWYFQRLLEPEQSTRTRQSGGRLSGIGASGGKYTGPARVVMSEDEFDKLQPGDVLVCPITSPVWSVLFPSVGALVTDTGGILAHPAIIAREYRIPAVVATGNATDLIKDGRTVTVDGDAGTVVIA